MTIATIIFQPDKILGIKTSHYPTIVVKYVKNILSNNVGAPNWIFFFRLK